MMASELYHEFSITLIHYKTHFPVFFIDLLAHDISIQQDSIQDKSIYQKILSIPPFFKFVHCQHVASPRASVDSSHRLAAAGAPFGACQHFDPWCLYLP